MAALENLNILADLRSAEPGAVRDAVRQCLCWVAILPVDGERAPKPGYLPGQTDPRYSYAPTVIAKLVFLSNLGLYHTAVLFRERDGKLSGYPPFKLRPATPAETVGGVADFPQPQCFIDGLTRAWAGRVYDWFPEKFAPGWSSEQGTPMPIVEFDWDSAAGAN